MTDYILYDATGFIVRYGSVQNSDYTIQTETGCTRMTNTFGPVDPLLHYIVAGVVTVRPDFSTIASVTNAGGWLANGVDVYSYGTSLPNPTEVKITCDNPRFRPVIGNVTTGTMDLTTNAAGTYEIVLKAFPYKDKILAVTAT